MRIGYIRVSTEEQNTGRQEVMMEQLGVDKVYIEKASGKNTARPQLKAMLEFAREGDIIVVESYSRCSRSTIDLLNIVADLYKKNIDFKSIKENIDTSTATGRLMFTIYAGLAQYERENTLERQREGIALAKEQGKYKGRVRMAIDMDAFVEQYKLWQAEEITAVQARKALGLSHSTFYRTVERYEKENGIQPTKEKRVVGK